MLTKRHVIIMEKEDRGAEFERRMGLVLGLFIGDALAMPVHWYYDRQALYRDYGWVSEFQSPKEFHPDSILYRSRYTALNERGEILHEAKKYWGKKGAHYHAGLSAGENTLNLTLAQVLLQQLVEEGTYDADRYLETYLPFMLTPGRHRDVYIEEYHRGFFQNYARGKQPRRCGVDDNHIGGLVPVGVLVAALHADLACVRAHVKEHIGLTHQNEGVLRAADCLATMLWRVVHGDSLKSVLKEEASDFFSARKSDRRLSRSDAEVLEREFSTACYIEKAFPASLYLSWKYADDFAAGLVSNTNLGGDNCHRGAVMGALLGAANGVRSIPSRWIDGLRASGMLKSLLESAACRTDRRIVSC